jgi:Ca2+/Na+ antiporter
MARRLAATTTEGTCSVSASTNTSKAACDAAGGTWTVKTIDECDEVKEKWPASINEFLGMAVYLLGLIFIFLGVAVVCDDYFCTSLEVICEQLELSTAVAGATFMAAGSSAPELATSVVAVFTTKDGTGLGTILGSAVFNLVMIVCLSGAYGEGPTGQLKRDCETAAGKSLPDGLYLDWRPMGRDAIFYVVSLALCVVFAITPVGGGWDDPKCGTAEQTNKMTCGIDDKPGFLWWEGLLLCFGYYFYVLTMIYDERLMRYLQQKFGLAAHILAKIGGSTFGRGARLTISAAVDAEAEALEKAAKLGGATTAPLLGGGESKTNGGAAVTPADGRDRSRSEEVGAKPHTVETSRPAAALAAQQEANRLKEGGKPRPAEEADKKGATSLQFVPAQGAVSLAVDGLDVHAQHKAALHKRVRFGNIGKFGRWNKAMAHERMQGWIAERKKVTKREQLHKKLGVNITSHFDEHTAPLVKRIEELEAQVDKLQRDLVPILGSKRPDYRQLEEDPAEAGDDDSFQDKFVAVVSRPWEWAFGMTIPACGRDDFNIWQDDAEAVPFSRLPEDVKLEVDLDPTKPDLWVRGKYPKSKVDNWYKNSKRYVASFIMSIVWIWLTSMGMVECAHRIGCHLGIGPFIMGLVVLSAGTSIPDALSSISVARQGEGDMAVANAVGSNVFNIFLGVGLPMMISEFVWSEPFVVEDKWPIVTTAVMLMVITAAMFFLIWRAEWILTPKLSWAMMPMFFVYIIANVLLEGDVIPLYEALE